MLNKFKKLKIYFFIKRKLFIFKYINKKEYGFDYLALILISILISISIMNILNIYYLNFDNKNYAKLYQDTGIALIGLEAIVFTLQIFNQEVKNEYMNSVMENIIDTKFQHIIQYIYLTTITILFLLIPNVNYFNIHITFFIPFYFLSLFSILVILGIDLFTSTSNSNKVNLIKMIETKTIYIMNCIDKVCEKINSNYKQNISKIEYLNKFNNVFISYIQSINSVIRNHINDPILFSNGMETYIKIARERLTLRKNILSYLNIPFFSEILPSKDNDSFIEKYLLEYLDEYARIALDNKNRDVLSIIQNVYYSIIIIGKDNKYINKDEIELTIKVSFSYYIKLIKYLIEFNNENLLFETIEIFKKIFIANYKDFYTLVNINFIDDIKEMTSIALSKKSLMNFRNIQGLITIPMYSIINSNNEYRVINIELLLDALKNSLYEFTLAKNLIKRRDEARFYLNYIIDIIQPYSFYKFIINYYNQQIDENNNFKNTTFFDDNMLEPFIKFLNDKLVTNCILKLNEDNRYVTGVTNIYTHITTYSDILMKLIINKKFNHIKRKNIYLLNICFEILKKYSLRYEKSNGMRFHEIDNYFELLINKYINIQQTEEIRDLLINSYLEILKEITIVDSKYRNDFEYFYPCINKIYNFCDDSNNIVLELINWYINYHEDKLKTIYVIYNELVNHSFFNKNLSHNNKEKLREVVKLQFISILGELKNNELNTFIRNRKLNINLKISKNNKINKILELINIHA